MRFFGTVFAILAVAIAAQADDVLLPGKSVSGHPDVIFVFVQGAQLDASRYEGNVRAIQAEAGTYGVTVWAAIPDVPFDLPVLEQEVETAAARVLAALYAAGAPSNAPIFIAGHSLGAPGAMGYAVNHSTTIKGAVFFGASLLRKYNDNFTAPWLQVNGEMDGLQRPSRVAESYYRHIIHSEDSSSAALNSGVVVLTGVNHLQFADGVNPPAAVKSQDLQAQVTMDEARADIARVTGAFLAVQTTGDSAAAAVLTKAVLDVTGPFLAPLVDVMLNQEGDPHLRPSCNSDHPAPQCPFYPAWPLQNGTREPSNDTDCTCQVLWANVAAVTMAGLPSDYSVYAVNAIHDVTDTKPYHHAHIWNNCTGPCVLNVTTVAQQIYPNFDDYDTGFTAATADEIRVKIKSRQAAFQQSGVSPNATLDVDDSSICAVINKMAIQYALDHASDVARERFAKYGQQIVAADDKPILIPIGPLWIGSKLNLNEVQQTDGTWILEVASPSMKTPVDGWITHLYPDSNGYHYCKLLSPARAMEWMYTDGLRRKLGLNNE